jgi:hypothetical protein
VKVTGATSDEYGAVARALLKPISIYVSPIFSCGDPEEETDNIIILWQYYTAAGCDPARGHSGNPSVCFGSKRVISSIF